MHIFVAEKTEAKPFSEIPEPKGFPLIGSILDYTKLKGFDITRLYEFTKKRHEMLGPIYKESARVGNIMIMHACYFF